VCLRAAVFALGQIGTGVLLSTLSYVERERILQDVGFSAIRFFGAAIAIFMGVGLIQREVERRTVYTILSPSRAPSSCSGSSRPRRDALIRWRSGACFTVSWLGAPMTAGHVRRCCSWRASGGPVAMTALFSVHGADAVVVFSAGIWWIFRSAICADRRQSGSLARARDGVLHRVPDSGVQRHHRGARAADPPAAVWRPLVYGACTPRC
jgi:hypothetical protein